MFIGYRFIWVGRFRRFGFSEESAWVSNFCFILTVFIGVRDCVLVILSIENVKGNLFKRMRR